jgi:hypothetical protein
MAQYFLGNTLGGPTKRLGFRLPLRHTPCLSKRRPHVGVSRTPARPLLPARCNNSSARLLRCSQSLVPRARWLVPPGGRLLVWLSRQPTRLLPAWLLVLDASLACGRLLPACELVPPPPYCLSRPAPGTQADWLRLNATVHTPQKCSA